MLCKEDKMKALPIVIAYNMEFWCNNWYVWFIYYTHNIWYVVKWFKFFCKFFSQQKWIVLFVD
jgi:hypothetical protein